MARHLAYAGFVTITSGQTASNILAVEQGRLGMALVIVAPATLTGTVGLYGAPDDVGTPQKVYVNGTAQTVPAASMQVYTVYGTKQVQVISGSSEGADRVFKIYMEIEG